MESLSPLYYDISGVPKSNVPTLHMPYVGHIGIRLNWPMVAAAALVPPQLAGDLSEFDPHNPSIRSLNNKNAEKSNTVT